MVSFNRVFLIGNLTKDPELRYTPQGTPVATLRMAINSPFKGKDGQAQEEVCFINVVVWSQLAEVCNQYLQKGRSVFVEGRLQSRSWKDKDGNNRSTIEVKAVRVQFMPKFAPKDEGKEEKSVDLGDAPEEIINFNNIES